MVVLKTLIVKNVKLKAMDSDANDDDSNGSITECVSALNEDILEGSINDR